MKLKWPWVSRKKFDEATKKMWDAIEDLNRSDSLCIDLNFKLKESTKLHTQLRRERERYEFLAKVHIKVDNHTQRVQLITVIELELLEYLKKNNFKGLQQFVNSELERFLDAKN